LPQELALGGPLLESRSSDVPEMADA